MKRLLLVLSLALSSGHVFAQAQNTSGQLSVPCFAPVYNLTEKVASIPFNTPVNSRFQISLPDNSGSTGYIWTWTDDSSASIVKHLGDGTYRPDNLSDNNNSVGSPTAKNFWRFKAVTPGRTVLTFSLARPWETGVAPIQQISFTIVVQPNDNIPQPPSAE